MKTEENTNKTMPPEELKNALADKVQDLLFPSESDRPIEAVSSVDAADAVGSSPETGAVADDNSISEVDFEDFYQKYGVAKDWQNDAQKDFAAKFGAALEMLRENTTNVKVVRRGQVEVAISIFGQTAGGEWIGLKTTAVETGE